VLAFLQSHFVIGILLGKNIKWDAQDRGEAQTTIPPQNAQNLPMMSWDMGHSLLTYTFRLAMWMRRLGLLTNCSPETKALSSHLVTRNL
jgi:membrane glycosyltransferase